MFSIESFRTKYDTDSTEVVIDHRSFHILSPSSLEPFVDPNDPSHHFPLWCKLWEASRMLAAFLAHKPVDPQKRLIEIGAGLGLVSIAAAAAGHDITLTEYNLHALQFAQANAYINGLPQLAVQRLDWNRPELDRKFDLLVGSEVVYKKQDFEPLIRLFQYALLPQGEIILASEARRIVSDFLHHIEPDYHLKFKETVLQTQGRETRVMLIKLSARLTSPTVNREPADNSM
jgi:2-polyprenyl-3-methyl-5-hydroxy-6-metoxy-1,4-benzoquinol methylase